MCKSCKVTDRNEIDMQCGSHCTDHNHSHHHDHSLHHEHSHEHGNVHEYCHEHCGTEEEESSQGAIIRSVICFLLLVTGLIMSHIQVSWFVDKWVCLAWYAVAFCLVGLSVIKEGWDAIREKDIFNEFTLMVVASIGAFCIGEYPEGVAVMLFYTVGEMLQDAAVGKATRNIKKLLDVRPEKTFVLRGTEYVEESPKIVKPGETIEVKPGGRVPLDGELLDNNASFDTSALTGESVPRNVDKGGEVLAGMIVFGHPVHIKVTRPYDKSALARILSLVKDATARKAPTELFIRRFARVYTPIVFALAVLIVAIPALVGAFTSFHYVFSEWLYRGLIFLVISCPCALVISVPLGYFAGIGAASKQGVLFKGSNFIDALTKVNTVAFDKTGTLTTGKFDVNNIESVGVPQSDLLDIILSTESKSTHPIAQAAVAFAKKSGAKALATSVLEEIAGEGVEAIIDNKEIFVGNLRMMRNHKVSYPESLENTTSTLIVCAVNGTYAGMLALSDTVKPDAQDAISTLKRLGITDVQMLSGDKKEVVKEYAAKLGITHEFGGMLPEDKARHIEEMIKDDGRKVAFVGDGMNDAPVLALSSVGIAMGGFGSDAAIESADVVIQTDAPSKVATAIKIARNTRDIVRENIVGAIGIKAVILVAGAFGTVSLWLAVFADVGVALLAVLNSLRLLYKKI